MQNTKHKTQNKIIPQKFFEKPTLEVTENLLGKYLVRKTGGKTIAGIITELEAYVGETDLACHAAKGRTKRTEIMYQDAGTLYVYMIYGMFYCLNVVTEKKDFPSAILIRAVKVDGIDFMATSGPGKLCKILKIDRKFNGLKLGKKSGLWIEDRGIKIKKSQIIKSKRIGVDYAVHCKDYLWRFSIKI